MAKQQQADVTAAEAKAFKVERDSARQEADAALAKLRSVESENDKKVIIFLFVLFFSLKILSLR